MSPEQESTDQEVRRLAGAELIECRLLPQRSERQRQRHPEKQRGKGEERKEEGLRRGHLLREVSLRQRPGHIDVSPRCQEGAETPDNWERRKES